MLDQMRKQANSSIILLLFGFIIFVFVFSFGSGSEGFRSGGCGQINAAAMVNGEAVGETEYMFYLDRQLQAFKRQRKSSTRMKKEEKLQLRHQVMDFLVDQTLLVQEARKLGLHVTDEERNLAIKKIPGFQDENGHFDFKLYKMIVQRQLQTTPAVFEETWRQQMMADRMRDIIRGAVRVTDEEIKSAYAMREAKVDLEYVRLSPASFRAQIQPTDAQIRNFIKDHLDRVKEAYNKAEARYHKPKKVQLAHVFFSVGEGYDEEQISDKKERADLTLEDLKRGSKIEDQAKEYSEDDTSKEKGGHLEMLTREAMSARWGTPLAEAAFKLGKGEQSKVLKSTKGFHVFQVMQIVEPIDQALEQVEKELAKELLIEKGADLKAKTVAERLLAGLKAGKDLESLLTAEQPAASEGKAKPGTIRVQTTGMVARMGGFIPQLGLDKDLARAAFALSKDKPVVEKVYESKGPIGGHNFLVMKLKDKAEPDWDKFNEQTDGLRKMQLMSRQQRQLNSWLQNRRDVAVVETKASLLMETTPRALQGR